MRRTDARGAALAAVAAALAACAGTPPPVAAPAPAPAAQEVGRSASVIVAFVQPDDTAERLAARYLGDSRAAWRVSPMSADRGLKPGSAAVIALSTQDYPPAVAAASQSVTVLCYHRFTSRPRSGSALEVTAADFDAQLDWLARSGHPVVPLKALESFLAGKAVLPPGAVVITIDDGYRSAFDVAFPRLKARGDPFTLFLYTDYVTGRGAALGWTEIDAMRRSGLADIESHTRSHPDLTRLPVADARRMADEVDGSRRLLQAHAGGEVAALAYPYGAVDARVLEATRRAGYRLATTVKRGVNPSWAEPLLLRRDMVLGGTTLAQFERLVASPSTRGS